MFQRFFKKTAPVVVVPESDSITFKIPKVEGPIEVSMNFSNGTDAERYGAALSAINKGILENTIHDFIVNYAKTNSLDNTAERILLEMERNSKEIDSLFESLADEEEFVAEAYPIIPAWGNPENSSLFDPDSISDSPRRIMWHFLEMNEEAGSDLEEDDDDNESEKPKNLYAVDGVPGLMNESQFRRLQDSDKPSYEIPPYDMWMGYTNFNIGLNTFINIANSNGVEYIKIVGRYSFVIAIGKMFENDFGAVRQEIEAKLGIEYSKESEI